MSALYLLRKWWLKHRIGAEHARRSELHRIVRNEDRLIDFHLNDLNARLRELESDQMQRRADRMQSPERRPADTTKKRFTTERTRA